MANNILANGIMSIYSTLNRHNPITSRYAIMLEEIIEVFAEGFERLQNAFNIVMKAGDICCALTAIVGVTTLTIILIYLKGRKK